MDKKKMKRLLILNIPYFIVGLFATNLGEAWRLAEGADFSAKLLGFFCYLLRGAFQSTAELPSIRFARRRCLRCSDAIGSLPERKERQEVPTQCGIWFSPLGYSKGY